MDCPPRDTIHGLVFNWSAMAPACGTGRVGRSGSAIDRVSPWRGRRQVLDEAGLGTAGGGQLMIGIDEVGETTRLQGRCWPFDLSATKKCARLARLPNGRLPFGSEPTPL